VTCRFSRCGAAVVVSEERAKAQADRLCRLLFLLLLVLLPLQVFAEQSRSHVSRSGEAIDPMNRPMDELGVTGHDTTLCSDRWNTCSSYDRQQFDQKYPGQRLKELLLYGEPSWPDRDRLHDLSQLFVFPICYTCHATRSTSDMLRRPEGRGRWCVLGGSCPLVSLSPRDCKCEFAPG
jgi:hypothetical protein